MPYSIDRLPEIKHQGQKTVLAIVVIVLVSALTRFWRLDGLADVVFDEVYYPKFAQDYLQGKPLFDAHPPLGKYVIALGIQLFGYNPFGYRCFSALAGSLVPLVTCALAYELSHNHRWAVLSGLFAAMDGLLLVESRYSLINIYIVLFGMLSQICMVFALKRTRQRWVWTVAAGIMLGAACSVKWNGIAYAIGLGAIAACVWWRYRQSLNLAQILLGLVVVPIATYLLVWVPHLAINAGNTPIAALIETHKQMYLFHQNLGAGETKPVHPYCSSWWSWPWLIRPIAYYYKTHPNGSIEFVNAMGNPFLYWLGAIAIILCTVLVAVWGIGLVSRHGQGARKTPSTQYAVPSTSSHTIYVPLYLVASFAGHYLPWSLSRRCTFLYHYMPASVFAFMAIALIVDWGWHHEIDEVRWICRAVPAIVVLAFVFWLPVYLGLSISSLHFRMLMWFPSWV